MARRDYAAKKAHSYKAPRKLVRRDHLRSEIIKRALRQIAYVLVFIGFIASLAYWIFFSPLFLIQDVEARGEGGEEHTGVLYEAYQLLAGHWWFFVSKSHYILLSEREFASKLENSDMYPIIEDVHVEKIWPNKLLVTFKERISRLTVIAVSKDSARSLVGDDHATSSDPFLYEKENVGPHMMRRVGEYLTDRKGIVTGQAEEKDEGSSQYPRVFVEADSKGQFRQGENIIGEKVVEQIMLLHRTFETYPYLPKIDYFFTTDALSLGDIALYTKEGYMIYFTGDYSLQKQVNHLLLTLERVGELQQKNLKYIDLRLENRSYVCCNLDNYVR